MPLTKVTPPNLHQTVKTMITTMVNETAVDSADVVTLINANAIDSADANSLFDTRLATKDTGDLSEGSNLYYTDTRADTRINLQTGSNLDLSSKSTSDLSEGSNLYYTDTRADARIAAASTTDLSEGTNLYYTTSRGDSDTGVYIAGNRTYGNITTTGYIAGPATMTIDPAAVGDNTGTLVVAGNLQVDGTTTTINSTTLEVEDKNVVLGPNAANDAANNGAGLTVTQPDTSNATLIYDTTSTQWEFNKALSVPSINTTGDITFGDNDKAIFGAGSDLQIYAVGGNSFIQDTGSGSLFVTGASGMYLQNGSNETYLDAFSNGAVRLFYDNALKLATTATGVEVTGAFTATTTGTVPTIYGGSGAGQTFTLQSTSGNSNHSKVLIGNVIGSDNGGISFYSAGTSVATERMRISGTTGDIRFYDAAGSNAKFFWDASAESLGIGTTSIPYITSNRSVLGINGATDSLFAMQRGGGNNFYIHNNSTQTAFINTAALPLTFGTSSIERMRIDSSGSVKINNGNLQIERSGSSPLLQFTDTGVNSRWMGLVDGTSNFTIYGTDGITQELTLDSSGNLLVGTTDADPNNNSTNTSADDGFAYTNGVLRVAKYNDNVAVFNKTGGDGTILHFRKSGIPVGNIGTNSGNIYLTDGARSLIVDGDTVKAGYSTGGDANAAQDLGSSSVRWRDLYLSGKITNDGTGGIQIDTSGNVGIGNVTSSTPLTSGSQYKIKMGQQYWNSTKGTDGSIKLELYSLSASDTYGLGVSASELEIQSQQDIGFYAGGNSTRTKRMHIEGSNGNVGIGTASPATNLHLKTTGATDFTMEGGASSRAQIFFKNDAKQWNVGVNGADKFVVFDSTLAREMITINDSEVVINDNGRADADFRVASDNNANCFKLDAGADEIYLGKSSGSGTAVGGIIHAKSTRFYQFLTETTTVENNAIMYLNRQSSDGKAIFFRRANSNIGNISLASSGTTYNTTSDRRLKDNIEPIADGTEKLMAMKPVTHTWKADPNGDAVHGFIAQEMQEVVPEAVSGEPDGDDMMSMDYGRITPIIVAALQDALKEIEELKTRINELEAK